MFKFIIPSILITISIALFFMKAKPLYEKISSLRDLSLSYNEALNNSKNLEQERDKLVAKYNTIDPKDIMKLEKLLPNNIDNIRTILEIEKIALPYGMVLKDVKYDTSEKNSETTEVISSEENAEAAPTRQRIGSNRDPYGTWELEFSTEGVYHNFILFLEDLEKNLRIVDVSSIEFSSAEPGDTKGLNPKLLQSYKYELKVKTYWLKN